MYYEKLENLYKISFSYEKQGLRKGQSLFNALTEVDPILAKSISGTEYDCFYQDDKIKNFIYKITFSWIEEDLKNLG